VARNWPWSGLVSDATSARPATADRIISVSRLGVGLTTALFRSQRFDHNDYIALCFLRDLF